MTRKKKTKKVITRKAHAKAATRKVVKKTTAAQKKATAKTQAAIAAAAKSVAAEPPAMTLEEGMASARKIDGGYDTSPPEPSITGTQDQRAEAQQRAAECSQELDAVLRRFRCRIIPILNPVKLVGGEPGQPASEGIISCSYGVAPQV